MIENNWKPLSKKPNITQKTIEKVYGIILESKILVSSGYISEKGKIQHPRVKVALEGLISTKRIKELHTSIGVKLYTKK